MITNDLKRIDPKRYYFDEESADYAVRFFSLLRQYQGEWAGKPFVLQDWQAYIVRQLFGWKRLADGLRMYRKAYIEVPRKNGKSTLCAGLALLLAFADGEPGAQVYTLANDREQAHIVFDCAKIMAETSSVLADKIITLKTSIVQESSHSVLRSLSSEAKTKAGYNISGTVIDELYAFDDPELVDLVMTATGARKQPLIIEITTAGYDQESICYQTYEYAKNVAAGMMEDPTFFTVIYEAEPKDDWTDPKVWRKVNPSLGVTVPESYLESECHEAINVPAKQNAFRRLFLNTWTQQSERWLDMSFYDKCVTNEPFSTAGRVGFVGLDLARTIDLVGCVELWAPLKPDGQWNIVPMAFIPGDNLAARSRTDHVPYDLWEKKGFIQLTPGNICDYSFIAAYLEKRREATKINDLVGDPWNFSQFSNELQADGWNAIEARQGYRTLSPVTKELQRMIMAGKIQFPDNPVLRWMFDNISIIQDPAGNIKPVKRNSASHIDLIIALLCALHGHLAAAPTVQADYYATHDLFISGG
jgi:phage terminase large subunit-like protein